MNTIIKIQFFVIVVGGCMDLELLDEMKPLIETETDSDPDDTGNTEGDTDSNSGPPDTDSTDLRPPALTLPDCGASERLENNMCIAEGPGTASVRFSTDEPAEVTASTDRGDPLGILSAPWSNHHHLVIGKLPRNKEIAVSIEIADINRNTQTTGSTVTAEPGPAVVITEILANPLGAEPDQEFIEIINLGDAPVDLSNWMVDDNHDANGDRLPKGTTLEPSQIALIVPSNFDIRAGADPSPHADARIVQVDSSLGSMGLKNSEAESIALYDEGGRLVSSFSGGIDPVEGVGTARVVAEAPDGDPWAFELDPDGTSTPGWAPVL